MGDCIITSAASLNALPMTDVENLIKTTRKIILVSYLEAFCSPSAAMTFARASRAASASAAIALRRRKGIRWSSLDSGAEKVFSYRWSWTGNRTSFLETNRMTRHSNRTSAELRTLLLVQHERPILQSLRPRRPSNGKTRIKLHRRSRTGNATCIVCAMDSRSERISCNDFVPRLIKREREKNDSIQSPFKLTHYVNLLQLIIEYSLEHLQHW